LKKNSSLYREGSFQRWENVRQSTSLGSKTGRSRSIWSSKKRVWAGRFGQLYAHREGGEAEDEEGKTSTLRKNLKKDLFTNLRKGKRSEGEATKKENYY